MRLLARLLVPLLLLFAIGGVAYSGANFTAPTRSNPSNALAAATLPSPAAFTATPAGRNVSLSWTAATPSQNYILSGGTATSSACSGVNYAALGTPAATTYSDARYTPQGTWYCYRLENRYRSFTSASVIRPVQLGVVATAVAITNGGISGSVDTGDVVTITFNQAISAASRPSSTSTVCASGPTDVIYLASTTTSGACAPETTQIGTLTGRPISNNPRWDATYAWNAAGTQLTITLTTRIAQNKNGVLGAGTNSFNPTTAAASLLSSTGNFHVCDTNTGGGNCLPTATGAF